MKYYAKERELFNGCYEQSLWLGKDKLYSRYTKKSERSKQWFPDELKCVREDMIIKHRTRTFESLKSQNLGFTERFGITIPPILSWVERYKKEAHYPQLDYSGARKELFDDDNNKDKSSVL